MDTPKSVSDLAANWPSIGDFAEAIGVKYEAARQMRARNSINPDHWPRVISASTKKGVPGITYEWLAQVRASEGMENAG